MTASETKTTIKVGIFVAIGLIAFVASIYVLGGGKFLRKTNTLFIEFQQAQGLTVGSIVSLAGLNIGNVSELTFATGRNIVLTQLAIESKYFSRITNNSTISVKTQGALGDKFIFIEPGEVGGDPIPDGATLTSAFQPDFLDILSSKTSEVGGSTVEVINEMRTLLKQLNSNNRIASLMGNLEVTSQSLSRLAQDPEIKSSLISLSRILKKIDNGDGTLGALINNSTLHDRLLGILGEPPRNRYLVPLIRESIKVSEQSAK